VRICCGGDTDKQGELTHDDALAPSEVEKMVDVNINEVSQQSVEEEGYVFLVNDGDRGQLRTPRLVLHFGGPLSI
jgi:hypothetical protein